MMDLRRFRNAIAILRSIDEDEFVRATKADGLWRPFRDDPVGFFVKLDDAKSEALWAIVEARQPKHDMFDARSKGGLARAANLTPERRREISQAGGKARWGNQ